MKIFWEREDKALWHIDCVPGRNNGIIKVVEHQEERSLVVCLHCGKRGYYPVGCTGYACSEEVPLD
uniref:Uncharacterized protein n=1 Tax=viral metagenome TaxID=1070528 RepID=A0A6H1ZRB5_9ZZZZ